jgi:hypothetical protein
LYESLLGVLPDGGRVPEGQVLGEITLDVESPVLVLTDRSEARRVR